ncbi:MAG: tetraacyldisaccharide 4'-kinase [Armatimonadetes bacterium]|nr:tetraacyldisaccharide 4'-kinase [Armatimonadota bacterium]
MALAPLSFIYAAGWAVYLGLYQTGIKRAKRPHQPVICVGNLRVGGTGKTPLTIEIARILVDAGHKVAISASGYGSPGSEEASLAPEGPLLASRWGDEPALMRIKLPSVPLIIGRNRVRAAALCHEHFPDHVMLMDDGFQHLPLAKDLTIVIDPKSENRLCFPAGPYRETVLTSGRADLIFPNDRFDVVRTEGLVSTSDGSPATARKVDLVLCALARPEAFFESLENHGWRFSRKLIKGDHDPLQSESLLQMTPKGSTILCSAKDWVKILERPDLADYQWLIADYEVRVEPKEEFRQWLIDQLGKKNDAS